MLTILKQTFHLLSREPKWRWVVLAWLALLVAGLEMLGAVLIYTLLSLVTDPGGSIPLPVIGDVTRFQGSFDDRTFTLAILAFMAAFFALRAFLKILVTYLKARLAHNAAARLSARLVEGYLRWPYPVHLHRTSADLIRNGHHVPTELVGQIILPVVNLFAEVLIVIGIITVLITIDPLATGLALATIGGGAVILLRFIQPRLSRLGSVHHEEVKQTLNTLQEAFAGIRDIKLLAKERFFAGHYREARLRMARAVYLRTTVQKLPPVVTELTLLGFILIYFTLVLLQGGPVEQSLSVLGLFAYAGMRVQPSLQLITAALNNFKYASAPLADLDEDLRSVESMSMDSPDAVALAFDSAWKLDDVTFRYEGSDADSLRGVSLEIQPGEQIGICGPTGGGKTTLVDVMIGLLEPTTGHVSIDGQPLSKVARQWHRSLGVVPQMIFLANDTLRGNIALGVPHAEIDESAVLEAVELAQLDDVIKAMPEGLDTRIGERGVRISGGQRQRLAIARALYRRPQVLIFDEGTSALDNATEIRLMRAIESLRGRKTIVMIAHRLSTVQDCDRVLVVADGCLKATGSYEALLTSSEDFRSLASDGNTNTPDGTSLSASEVISDS